MTARSPKVVVVAGSYVDTVIKCSHIPLPGQSVTGSSFSCSMAGSGPNQAIEAALCGCDVHLISMVGDDPSGQMVKEGLAEYNVNTDFVYTARAKNTGSIFTLVNSEGENAACIYDGANSFLLPKDIDAAEQVISDADVCLIHGRLPHEIIDQAIRCAQLNGTKTILNPARPLESQQGADSQSNNLPLEFFSVDILIPNLYEAAKITERSAANIRTAKLVGSELVARGAKSAVITMGKRGCMVVDRDGAYHIPAFEIDIVDHTCTGDAFAGALAASYAAKDDLKNAVIFASAAGALACKKFGSIEALPTRADIIELLQKQDIG